MANFINPEALRKADAARRDVNGQSAALDAIRKALRSPLRGDPVALAKAAKGVSASRAKDPNADDAYVDKDEDDADLDADEDEDEDIKARRKARKDAARALRSNAAAAKRAIKSIHDSGPRSEDPDAIIKAAATKMRYRDDRPSFKLIKQAQSKPLTMTQLFGSGNNNHPIDMHAVQRIIAQGKREMRKAAGVPSAEWNRMSGAERQAAMGKGATATFKPQFPRNSANGTWGGAIADTGASNNWDDEGTQLLAIRGLISSRILPLRSTLYRAGSARIPRSARDTSWPANHQDKIPGSARTRFSPA